jgi:hypothetical protein
MTTLCQKMSKDIQLHGFTESTQDFWGVCAS